MNYLFFDCEFASSLGGVEKICEFGYVVTDEHFKPIERGNIIINPNIDNKEWDWYALKHILTRKKKEYFSYPFFPECYPEISRLIREADKVFGHSILMDIHALECECKRYNLPTLKFEYQDIKDIYKKYASISDDVSLEKMLSSLNVVGDEKIHDAGADAYNTMLVLKAITKQ